MDKKVARLIPFYLPQYHPIPENDAWWGKGFTEWTNVVKAKPLFPGHYQPHIPADLGFYDLRVPETREAQAEMARKYGIEGFCYWHYWFAGKRLLERPFNEVLRSGRPDFPFCLAWANQTWTGVWHGDPERVLVEQTYPGEEDYVAHFYSVIEALGDNRYIKVGGKPIFVVYNPRSLPDPKRFTDCWRELAAKSGLKGIYFLGVAGADWIPGRYGFDASVIDNPGIILSSLGHFLGNQVLKLYHRLKQRDFLFLLNGLRPKPAIYSYKNAIRFALPTLRKNLEQFPCVIPNWDNTPRSGKNGVVFHGSNPSIFKAHLTKAIKQVADRDQERRIVFIKSWNEWAEGNHLEPDNKSGKSYLEVVREVNRVGTKNDLDDDAFSSIFDRDLTSEYIPPIHRK